MARTSSRPRSALLDLGLLIMRLAVGATFLMHGWQKFDQQGIAANTQALTQLQVPYAQIVSYLQIALELGGGALLILGFAVRILALLFLVDMAGAFWYVTMAKGFFVSGGGYELVLLLGAVSLMFICTGGGRFGVDGAFVGRRRADADEPVKESELEPVY